MRTCPNCRKGNKQYSFDGWVLRVKGSVTLDEEGNVESISPLTSVTTIKTGKELDGKLTVVTCPECGYVGHFKEFTPNRVCWLTGNAATIEITVPSLGSKWISEYADATEILRVAQLYAEAPILSTMEEISAACAD